MSLNPKLDEAKARKIKAAREAKKWTLNEMAEKLTEAGVKMSKRSYQRIEKTGNISYQEAEQLKKIFGFDLFGEGDEEITIDRGIILEMLLRNLLLQTAKDRAFRDGKPEKWEEYEQEINNDGSEIMVKMAKALNLPAADLILHAFLKPRNNE